MEPNMIFVTGGYIGWLAFGLLAIYSLKASKKMSATEVQAAVFETLDVVEKFKGTLKTILYDENTEAEDIVILLKEVVKELDDPYTE